MHDIHLANQIANIVKAHAEKRGIKIIKKLKIALGNISEHGETISADNLEFNIKLLLGYDVDVDIERMEGDGWKLEEICG